MARLIRDDNEVEIVDGSRIIEGCRKLRVSFGCTSGLCGTCNIIVLEGMDNLSERTEQEDEMGLPKENRLACQCTVKKGVVKIRY